MTTDRLNARLPKPLAQHVNRMIAKETGKYENPSEYIRDLIRRDMERTEASDVKGSIVQGYLDFAEGRFFKSTGNFHEDMEILEEKEKNGWSAKQAAE